MMIVLLASTGVLCVGALVIAAARISWLPYPDTFTASKIERFLPHDTYNFAARRNYIRFAAELKQRFSTPSVLVIGAGIGGPGTDALVGDPAIRVVNSDLNPSNPTYVNADAHALPFPECSFEGVAIQTVLEHIFDPYLAVAEIHRVLKPGGLVYSDTPFMQQVHGAEFDFTRFTFLGHRRLFRHFAEIDSGISVGPGSAFGWAFEYFWLTFTSRRGLARNLVRAICRVTTFWAPLLDPWLSKLPGAYDSASQFYFIGSKAESPISDADLLKVFRGVR